MALADLLRAIEADAESERARADRETALEAAAIIERARREAGELEAALAAAPEAEARAEAERSAPAPAWMQPRAIRAAREDAFASAARRHPRGARRPARDRRVPGALPGAARREPRRSCRARASSASIGATWISPRRSPAGCAWSRRSTRWGGVELASDDGRTVRNTLEERLANAELLLRYRFAQRLATTAAPVPASVR